MRITLLEASELGADKNIQHMCVRTLRISTYST